MHLLHPALSSKKSGFYGNTKIKPLKKKEVWVDLKAAIFGG